MAQAWWPDSAQADVTGQIGVVVRVGSGLPDTGWGFSASPGLLLGAAAALILLGAAALRLGRRRRPLWAGLGLLVGLGAAGLGLSQPTFAWASPEAVILIDADSRSGTATVSLDVSALASPVYRVYAQTDGTPGVRLAFAGVPLDASPTPVATVADQRADGLVTGQLTATVPADLPAGDYRLTLAYSGVDQRVVVELVQADFPDRPYDGGVAVQPVAGSVALPEVTAGADVRLRQPQFTAAAKDAGQRAVALTATGLDGADAWRYRLADQLRTDQSITITPRPLSFDGAVVASKPVGRTDPVALAGDQLRVEGPTSFSGLVAGESFGLAVSGQLSVDFGTSQEVVEPRTVSSSGGAFQLTQPSGGALAANYDLARPELTGEVVQPIELTVTVGRSGQTLALHHYWTNAYLVDWGDDSLLTPMEGDPQQTVIHAYDDPGTYTVRLTSALDQVQRWTWQTDDPVIETLVPASDTSATVLLSALPQLRALMPTADRAEDNFFYAFNDSGALLGLPDGSFDTSAIRQVGDGFFRHFNISGDLTELPAGSFDTSAITRAGDYFFASFSGDGDLTGLPAGSFDTSGMTEAGDFFFYAFNSHGNLVELPAGSFDTGAIRQAGDYFFEFFNHDGALTGLPAGSFDLGAVESAGQEFFGDFNSQQGQLAELPAGSFDTARLRQAGDYLFHNFNYGSSLNGLPAGSFRLDALESVGDSCFVAFNWMGGLTSLPDGSFDIRRVTGLGAFFFANFNSEGALTRLPAGSFRLDGVAVAPQTFFQQFNASGALIELPAGSFQTGQITSVGSSFFESFNYLGALTALPEGSFDTSQVAQADDFFFADFNHSGAIADLPDSFRWPDLWASQPDLWEAFYLSFNSSTVLNRAAADLVGGLTAPPDQQFTFSDNQPGVDLVDPNWVGPLG